MLLTKKDSLALKGIAILAMIVHHVIPSGIWLGDLCEICIAFFLFLSGYGLSVSYTKIPDPSVGNKFRFIAKRLTKFYESYWPVFIICVPIFIILSGKNPTSIYNGKWWKIFFEFLGFSSAYNPHWWFNRIILIYYILFPFIIPVIRRLPFVSFSISLFAYKIPGIPYDIKDWICVFVLGMSFFFIEKKQFMKFDVNSTKFKLYYAVFNLCILILGFIQYFSPILPYIKGRKAFVIIVLGLIGAFILVKDYVPRITKFLSFFGKHSANIYFSHLFLYGYYGLGLPILNYPLGMFIYVTLISLAFSICLEKLKKCIGITELSNNIQSKLYDTSKF